MGGHDQILEQIFYNVKHFNRSFLGEITQYKSIVVEIFVVYKYKFANNTLSV